MSYIRINLDLAFKEPLSSEVKTKLAEAKDKIKALKVYASKINEGLANEEITIKATWHRCHHDTGNEPCEKENEI